MWLSGSRSTRTSSARSRSCTRASARYASSTPTPRCTRASPTVAVLQVLGNLPVTRHSVASLMHPEIAARSHADDVAAAIDDMLGHPRVPLGEQDGGLSFFSKKLNDIEQERAELPLRPPQLRGILHARAT